MAGKGSPKVPGLRWFGLCSSHSLADSWPYVAFLAFAAHCLLSVREAEGNIVQSGLIVARQVWLPFQSLGS